MADNVIDAEFLRRRISQIEGTAKAESAAPLHGGGGGGTFDGMEARVARLEKAFEKIDGALTALRVDVSEIKGRVTTLPDVRAFGEMKGKIDTMPSGEAFGRMANRVERLPTVASLTGLLGLFAVVVAAAANARTVLGWLGVTF